MPTDREVLYSDQGYTGESTIVDDYRNKVRDFQVHMNALGATAESMAQLYNDLTAEGTDASGELADQVAAWLNDFYANTGRLQAASSTINAAAATADLVGVRLPAVSLPQQLAAVPAAIIAVVAGALAAIAWAVSYAVGKMQDARAVLNRRELIALLPENQRAAALAADQQIATAQANASNPLGQLAGIVKWAALGVAAWFGFKALQEAMR